MDITNPSLIVLIIILLILFIERKNFDREGLVFLRRSKKGISLLEKISRKYSKKINIIGDFGILLSFGVLSLYQLWKENKKNKKYLLSMLGVYLLINVLVFNIYGMIDMSLKGIWGYREYHSILVYLMMFFSYVFGIGGFAFSLLLVGSFSVLYNYLFLSKEVPSPLQIVLPVNVPSKYNLPILTVPFDKWLISIGILVIVHEFSHAILALSNKIKVKSIGYGFLLILPLGFAEPDENQLRRKKVISRLRVYAAGSFSNFVFALIFALLFLPVSIGIKHIDIYEYKGISYNGLINSTFAYSILPSNGTITAIGGHYIHNFTEFITLLRTYKPGENISLLINGHNYTITLSSNPNNKSLPFIGIKNVKEEYTIKENIGIFKRVCFYLLSYVGSLFMWISLLNIGIGIANLLPMFPLDGGLMIRDMFENRKILYRVINILTLLLLLFSLFGKYIIKAII